MQTQEWATIAAQLPPGWQQLASDFGLVRPLPPHLGAKIRDADTLLRLVLQHVALDTSLRVATAMSAAAEQVQISPNSLHKRMRKVGPYLAALLAQLTDSAARFAAERWAGYQVLVADASVVTRPGAQGTTARVHYVLRLSDLRPVQLQVTDEHGGETLRRFDAEPEQLWVVDRGLAKPPGIVALHDAGAAVLARYSFGSLPLYDAQGVLLDVAALASTRTAPQSQGEWEAWVPRKDGEPVRGRLCITRLPGDKAAEARARLIRDEGKKVSAERLAMASYLIVFTTVPAARMDTEQVLALYRLRWAVELQIKRDKSIGGLDRLPNFRADTIYAWLCGKLLAQELARRVAATDAAFPPGAERTRKHEAA